MKNRVSRAFATLICVLLSAVLISFSVSARGYVDIDRKASLTINYVSQNADFSIYKVGDISNVGELSLSGDFAKYPVSLNNDQDSWSELATTLKGYVASDGISPVKSGRTDADKMLKFSDLSVGLYLVIGENTVETANNTKTIYSPSPFLICLPNIVDENSEWIYDVSARPKYEIVEQEIIDIEAQKIWDDAGNENSRPASIEIQLMCGDKVYDTQVLSEDNGWKYAWTELDAKENWSIVEKNIPSDYTVKISKDGNMYTVTNTFSKTPTTTENVTENVTENTTEKDNDKPGGTTSVNTTESEDNPKLPQTGLLWWPVGLLLVAGLTLILAGVIRKTKSENK